MTKGTAGGRVSGGSLAHVTQKPCLGTITPPRYC
jgi:hypothetical protein